MHTEDQEEFTGSPTGGNPNISHPMAAPYRKQGPRLAASQLSPFRLLVTIIVAIFMAEVVAMVVVYALESIPFIQLTLIDATIMTLLIFPVLYLLSFQPLLRYIQKSQQAEAALVRSMDLQERFFDSIDILIAYMDRDFNFIRVNEAYARADGRRPEFFIGKNHFDLYPHPENQALFQRVVESGEAFSVYEKPFEYPEAPERGVTYWNWSLLPVKGAEERVEGVVLSLVDVTERKRAEEKNRQLSRIVEQTADTVVVTDCDGVIEYVNPAFTKMTGYTLEDAIGKTPSMLKSGMHDARFYKELWKTILEGEVFQSEIANRRKNGELFYEEKTITPLRDERGDITHFVATGKDISERKKAEDDLRRAYEELELRVQARTQELRFANSELEEEIAYRRQAEDKLQQQAIELESQAEELLSQKMDLVVANEKLIQIRMDLDRAQEVGQIGSWRLDVRRNVLTWSDETYRIFGVPLVTPLTYESFLEIVHPDDRHYVNVHWNAALAGDAYEIEHRILVDGAVKWVHEKAFMEFNENRTCLEAFGIAQDITERKQAEARQAYLASFPEQNPNLVMEVDFEGQVRYANPATLMFFPELPKQGLAHAWLADWEVTIRQLREDKVGCIVRDLAIGDRFFEQSLYPIMASGLVRIYGTDITERKRAEAEIQRAVEEVHAANQELKHFNTLMVGRELRMIELKKEVNELCTQTNQPARYPLEFEMEGA